MDQSKIDSISWYPQDIKNICYSFWARMDKFYFFGFLGFVNSYLCKNGPALKEILLVLENSPQNNSEKISLLKSYDGHLPLKIWSANENHFYDKESILVRMEVTDKNFIFLPDLLAPLFIRSIWYSSSVASMASNYSELIRKSLAKTSDLHADHSRFMVYGFGQRSASSFESATIAGAATLQFFERTDIYSSKKWLLDFYGIEKKSNSFKTLSLDHSRFLLMDAFREKSDKELIENIYEEFDSYSFPLDSTIFNEMIPRLKSIIPLIPNKKILTIKWDSDDFKTPADSITKLIVDLSLVKTNSKGFLTFPNNIYLMFTNDITIENAENILEYFQTLNFSTDHLIFGIGTHLIQNISRDTFGVVGKMTAAQKNDKWVKIEKHSSDCPSKRGLGGRLSLSYTDSSWKNVEKETTDEFPLIYDKGPISN
jgi:nicotinamide phosphoribosyltransferase